MLLQDKENDTLIEILDIESLVDPVESKVSGSRQAGEEEQPPEEFSKDGLKFPSGEGLPRCWTDAEYKASL